MVAMDKSICSGCGKIFPKRNAEDRRAYDAHVKACWLDERDTQADEEPTIEDRVAKLEEMVEFLMGDEQ